MLQDIALKQHKWALSHNGLNDSDEVLAEEWNCDISTQDFTSDLSTERDHKMHFDETLEANINPTTLRKSYTGSLMLLQGTNRFFGAHGIGKNQMSDHPIFGLRPNKNPWIQKTAADFSATNLLDEGWGEIWQVVHPQDVHDWHIGRTEVEDTSFSNIVLIGFVNIPLLTEHPMTLGHNRVDPTTSGTRTNTWLNPIQFLNVFGDHTYIKDDATLWGDLSTKLMKLPNYADNFVRTLDYNQKDWKRFNYGIKLFDMFAGHICKHHQNYFDELKFATPEYLKYHGFYRTSDFSSLKLDFFMQVLTIGELNASNDAVITPGVVDASQNLTDLAHEEYPTIRRNVLEVSKADNAIGFFHGRALQVGNLMSVRNPMTAPGTNKYTHNGSLSESNGFESNQIMVRTSETSNTYLRYIGTEADGNEQMLTQVGFKNRMSTDKPNMSAFYISYPNTYYTRGGHYVNATHQGMGGYAIDTTLTPDEELSVGHLKLYCDVLHTGLFARIIVGHSEQVLYKDPTIPVPPSRTVERFNFKYRNHGSIDHDNVRMYWDTDFQRHQRYYWPKANFMKEYKGDTSIPQIFRAIFPMDITRQEDPDKTCVNWYSGNGHDITHEDSPDGEVVDGIPNDWQVKGGPWSNLGQVFKRDRRSLRAIGSTDTFVLSENKYLSDRWQHNGSTPEMNNYYPKDKQKYVAFMRNSQNEFFDEYDVEKTSTAPADFGHEDFGMSDDIPGWKLSHKLDILCNRAPNWGDIKTNLLTPRLPRIFCLDYNGGQISEDSFSFPDNMVATNSYGNTVRRMCWAYIMLPRQLPPPKHNFKWKIKQGAGETFEDLVTEDPIPGYHNQDEWVCNIIYPVEPDSTSGEIYVTYRTIQAHIRCQAFCKMMHVAHSSDVDWIPEYHSHVTADYGVAWEEQQYDPNFLPDNFLHEGDLMPGTSVVWDV